VVETETALETNSSNRSNNNSHNNNNKRKGACNNDDCDKQSETKFRKNYTKTNKYQNTKNITSIQCNKPTKSNKTPKPFIYRQINMAREHDNGSVHENDEFKTHGDTKRIKKVHFGATAVIIVPIIDRSSWPENWNRCHTNRGGGILVGSEGKSAGSDARPAVEMVHDTDIVRQCVGRPTCGADIWGRGDEVSGSGLEQDRTLSPKENVRGASQVPDAAKNIRGECNRHFVDSGGRNNGCNIYGAVVGDSGTTAGRVTVEIAERVHPAGWDDDSAVCRGERRDDQGTLHGVYNVSPTVVVFVPPDAVHARVVPGKNKEICARMHNAHPSGGQLRCRGEVGTTRSTAVAGADGCNRRDAFELLGTQGEENAVPVPQLGKGPNDREQRGTVGSGASVGRSELINDHSNTKRKTLLRWKRIGNKLGWTNWMGDAGGVVRRQREKLTEVQRKQQRTWPVHAPSMPPLDIERLMSVAAKTPFYDDACLAVKILRDPALWDAATTDIPAPRSTLRKSFVQQAVQAGVLVPLPEQDVRAWGLLTAVPEQGEVPVDFGYVVVKCNIE
jgi:hypothetical protein